MRKRLAKAAFALLAACLLTGVALWWAMRAIPLPERLGVDDSVVVEYANGMTAHVFLSEDDRWRIPVRLHEVQPEYLEALVRFEDKRFYEHGGVDTVAVLRAAWLNLSHGRRMSGASTLTMQLVRVLEPRPRTYRSKAIEAFRAIQLESRMSKEQILEAYLRFAPYGRNIEGIEAASLAYFGHRATDLSPEEIATLLAVPQNPNIRYPAPGNEERLRAARDEIAQWLLEEGVLPLGPASAPAAGPDVLAMVRGAAVPAQLRPFPREVPHVARWVRARNPQSRRIKTNIDGGIQAIIEGIAANHRDDAQRAGVGDVAIVLMDTETRDVAALVGNFDFYTDRHGAQIPAFDVARSPGSLLKPFIYGLAIDRGVAHPKHLVVDAPVQLGTYRPTNFDGTFDGLVRLDDALSRSLNVPFVTLLDRVGTNQFLNAIRDMGGSHVAVTPGVYGLTAAVGGVPITPLEATGMYATLADDGNFRPPRITSTDPRPGAMSILTPGATWLVRDTLRRRERPGFRRSRVNPGAERIFWKTGTSFGQRDAWAAGANGRYTAVVWLGNLDTTPSHALVGARSAAPLLFDVLEAFPAASSRDPRPDDLVEVEVCSYSGHLPTDACPTHVEVWGAKHSVPTATCPYHVRVDVDLQTGEALSPLCRAGRDYESRSFITWPASVRRYLRDRNGGGRELPSYAEECGPGPSTKAPRIVSPPLNQSLVLRPGVASAQQEIPLEAEAGRAGSRLSWFVNGDFVGTAPAEQRVWWTPKPGKHLVVVMDDSGQAARRQIVVR